MKVMVAQGKKWRLVAALLCTLTSPALADDARRDAFRDITREIIAGIDAGPKAKTPDTQGTGGGKTSRYMEKTYNYVRPTRMRIAVAPFEQDDIKIAKAVADDFNAALFAALIKQGAGRFDIMARAHLKALIDDMQQTGAWEAAAGNPINALLQNAGKVDVLIRGRIRSSGQLAILTYTAIAMDGRVLSQTLPHTFQLNPQDAKVTRATIALDQAIKAAARDLVDNTRGLDEILLGGIRFEDTGAQPQFGRYPNLRDHCCLRPVGLHQQQQCASPECRWGQRPEPDHSQSGTN